VKTRGRAGLLASAGVALGTLVGAQEQPPPADPVAPPAEETASTATPVRRPPRWSAFVGGALAMANAPFEGERRFTEFAEEGRLSAGYERALGPGFELGLEFAPRPRFGVSVHFNALSRGSSTDYDASLPHPLHLGRPREVEGSVDGLSYTERAVHLDLAWRRSDGRLRYAVFAGPTWASATAELVQGVQYQQAYPFDTVQVTGVTRGTYTGHGFGFNAGAELGWQVGAHAAAALLVRYHRANADLPDAAGGVTLQAGGLQVGAGIRWLFR
jgi:hypothetical protein